MSQETKIKWLQKVVITKTSDEKFGKKNERQGEKFVNNKCNCSTITATLSHNI